MFSIHERAILEDMTWTRPVLAFLVDAQDVFGEITANGYTDEFLPDAPSAVIDDSITTLLTEKNYQYDPYGRI